MEIVKISIKNFRGISEGTLFLSNKVVLVGDNNTGKSTVINAIDLVLGPERMQKFPVINEHDFYGGNYLIDDKPQEIFIELVITNLSDEQKRYFGSHIEWWDTQEKNFINPVTPEKTDNEHVIPAIRVFFLGKYDTEEDNFTGGTYYAFPKNDNDEFQRFTINDKRYCGFLFLRTLRTGKRALTLERGALLDIIFRIKEKRLTMWEETLKQLKNISIAENDELGISEILSSVQNTAKEFVPADWIENPKLKFSDLTRESLRKTLMLFIETGAVTENDEHHSAPFYCQGTGTANILVLSLLSQIASLKQNVIFSMEEPEIAISPHTQKQVVKKIWLNSTQSIFTSHSPYVLEMFNPDQIVVLQNTYGKLKANSATLPPAITLKRYRNDFRTRYCEALLAKYVFLTEGKTEFDVYTSILYKLSEELPEQYKNFESLGIAVIIVDGDSNILPLASYFKSLGKIVFAVFDKQEHEISTNICKLEINSYELPEKGIESAIVNNIDEVELRKYANKIISDGKWDNNKSTQPTEQTSTEDLRKILITYLSKGKGDHYAADLLLEIPIEKIPSFIIKILSDIQNKILTISSKNLGDL